MKSERITNISSYIDYVMEKRSEMLEQENLNNSMWFFRGQKCDQWSVIPSVFRGDSLSVERDTIGDALRRNPFEFRNMSEFEVLTKLQHYGLSTRLLDVTLNPLVALFFATEPHVEYTQGKNYQYTQKKYDGIVYYGYKQWHTPTELPAIITSAIPFTDFNQDMTVDKFLIDLLDNHMITSKQKDYLSSDSYSPFVSYIQGNYFTRSDQSNERLVRQSGAFLIPASLNIVGDDNNIGARHIEKSKCVLDDMFVGKICIPEEYKPSIRDELDFFNINESTMFPELEHQMTYIQSSNRAVSGIVPDFKVMPSSIRESNSYSITESEPNVRKILGDYLGEVDQSTFSTILNSIQESISLIDWKHKESIRTSIHANIITRLKRIYSLPKAHTIADDILAQLLAPSEQYTA